ncbi:MAG: hypothetical protein IIC22_05110, partial [Chloroflexi bacterium]|nr:hypothetical protein [Chloroflexota bacterium]
PRPAPFVDAEFCLSRDFLAMGEEPLTRTGIVTSLTRDEIDASTSFGRVAIDTIQKTATFEVRDNTGQIRAHSSGFRMMETIKYL